MDNTWELPRHPIEDLIGAPEQVEFKTTKVDMNDEAAVLATKKREAEKIHGRVDDMLQAEEFPDAMMLIVVTKGEEQENGEIMLPCEIIGSADIVTLIRMHASLGGMIQRTIQEMGL